VVAGSRTMIRSGNRANRARSGASPAMLSSQTFRSGVNTSRARPLQVTTASTPANRLSAR
jgi:hypothetical protein